MLELGAGSLADISVALVRTISLSRSTTPSVEPAAAALKNVTEVAVEPKITQVATKAVLS